MCLSPSPGRSRQTISNGYLDGYQERQHNIRKKQVDAFRTLCNDHADSFIPVRSRGDLDEALDSQKTGIILDKTKDAICKIHFSRMYFVIFQLC